MCPSFVVAVELTGLAGTVIEYARNAAAEYAISQMIRENSGCPGAILREPVEALFFMHVRSRARHTFTRIYVYRRVHRCMHVGVGRWRSNSTS